MHAYILGKRQQEAPEWKDRGREDNGVSCGLGMYMWVAVRVSGCIIWNFVCEQQIYLILILELDRDGW